jgi:hypothetical protein
MKRFAMMSFMGLALSGCIADEQALEEETVAETSAAVAQQTWVLSSNAGVFDLDVGPEYVVWSKGTSIYRIGKDGSGERQICSQCGRAVQLVADWTHVYFLEETSRSVRRVPIGGGSPEVLASPSNLETSVELVLDPYSAFFATSDGIHKVSKSGGAVTTLVSGPDVQPLSLAGENNYLYWLGDGKLRKLRKRSGQVTELTTTGWGARGLKRGSNYVFWCEGTSNVRGSHIFGHQQLYFPGTVDSTKHCSALDTNGHDVFYAQRPFNGQGYATISKVSIEHPTHAPQVLHSVQASKEPNHVTADAFHVYWADLAHIMKSTSN